jgi:hypothetical protein
MLDEEDRSRRRDQQPARTNIVVQQNTRVVAYREPKSVALAVLLAFLFGPLGMIYSTGTGAVVMFLVNVLLVLPTLGLILLITIPVGMLWAGIAASNSNQRVV